MRIAETAKTMGTEILDHIIIAGKIMSIYILYHIIITDDNAFSFKGKELI